MIQQQSLPSSNPATVTVFASPTSWIESDALAQCQQVAALDGMIHVAGMPDLHPGKGAPIGAAMASTVLYPFLVGSDIGCGIAVFPVRLKRAVPERLAARFPDLDRTIGADDRAWAVVEGDVPAGHLDGLGTVGRGNHFVELARVGPVLDPGHAARLGVDVEELRRTPLGSLVVCGDRQLLFEEAPTAYKRIEQVVADLVEHRLATPVANTIPLVTYKTADLGPASRTDRRGRRGGRGRS
ncbi:RtcB family protein [Micromonospora chokoriensis]|uniref:3'-phosphate/5'-hydroxy nucleic acid ligase n=1 Tax=Micromonospora chokoriensis TaxID=356851 RepID=A0A1C4Z229_9ACTN|nr:RtcB family protein [Micromonospora chokoriensis]SCF26964.1 tRNA-splicing ligase RtcB [Micromonospora chokoriensis]